MPKRPPPPNKQRSEVWLTPAVLTALIALLGTVIAACVSSPALVALISTTRAPAAATAIPLPATATASTVSSEQLSVTIDGPTTAALDTQAYFTIVSSGAVRGVWSISGFQNEPVMLEPLGASHEIYVEPTDRTRLGDSFTLVFTVYDDVGNSATAQHRFEVVSR